MLDRQLRLVQNAALEWNGPQLYLVNAGDHVTVSQGCATMFAFARSCGLTA